MKNLIFCFLLSVSLSVVAQDLSNMKPQDLMKAFWQCHKLSDETEGAGQRFPENMLGSCSLISKEVQNRFFNGDFGLMHNWTLKNKKSAPLIVK